jgi:hypothetical protein
MQSTKVIFASHAVLAIVIALLLYARSSSPLEMDPLCPAMADSSICMIGP